MGEGEGNEGAGVTTGFPLDFSLLFPPDDDFTLTVKQGSLLLPSPLWGWLGASPAFLGDNLFWEEFKQTNGPLRGTNRSVKMAFVFKERAG